MLSSDNRATQGERVVYQPLLTTLAGISLLSNLVICPNTSHSSGTSPNILLIVSDDQGAQMGALGTPGVSTPNMDSIASDGTLFRKAYVPHPTCSVSRASMLTGTVPHTHGTLVNVNEHFGPDPTGESWYSNPNSPYNQNRIDSSLPTLIEQLDANGYRTAITSKLHMAPHDRFPFDVWIDDEIDGTNVVSGQPTTLQQFMTDSDTGGNPFFAMVNLRSPHRPLANFQTNSQPDPDPNLVELPDSLPDTQIVKNDWIEYLKAVQRTDDKVGEALQALTGSGLENDTVVIFMGDHGPAYHNGKWTPYNFGLHVPLAIKGPGLQQGVISDEPVSSIDLMPTLLGIAGITAPTTVQGESLENVLAGTATSTGREYIVGELIHPSGLQERSIHEKRYHLIYRDNVSQPRLVPADNRDVVPWGNPVYQETINQQGSFPAPYQQLTEIDNGTLGGTPRTFELYDLQNDPWEIDDLANDPNFAPHRNRMLVALQVWATKTNDSAIQLYRTVPAGSNGPVNVSDNFDGATGSLDANANWTTRLLGNNGTDFTLGGNIVDAPAGPRVLATYDGVERATSDDFVVTVDTQFNTQGVGGGIVFGYTDDDNFFEFQLLDGRSSPGGVNKDIRLRQRSGGVESDLLFTNLLPNYMGGWYNVSAAYTAETMTLDLAVLDDLGSAYFQQSLTLSSPIEVNSQFGISTWASGASDFDNFLLELTTGLPPDGLDLLGDFNGDDELTSADIDAITSAFGSSGPATAQFNLAMPDEAIDQTDVLEWLQVVLPTVTGIESTLGDANLDGFVDVQDLHIWESNYGEPNALWSDGDFDGDGDVDGLDFLTWQKNAGFQSSALVTTLASTVPEPSTPMLGMIFIVIANKWVSQRRFR